MQHNDRKLFSWNPKGVLRNISDGDVRSPFLGLKFATWEPLLGLKFCSDFFWVKDFGKDFFGGWKKRNPGFSFLCQTIVSWHKNCLEFSSIIIIIIIIF